LTKTWIEAGRRRNTRNTGACGKVRQCVSRAGVDGKPKLGGYRTGKSFGSTRNGGKGKTKLKEGGQISDSFVGKGPKGGG